MFAKEIGGYSFGFELSFCESEKNKIESLNCRTGLLK